MPPSPAASSSCFLSSLPAVLSTSAVPTDAHGLTRKNVDLSVVTTAVGRWVTRTRLTYHDTYLMYCMYYIHLLLYYILYIVQHTHEHNYPHPHSSTHHPLIMNRSLMGVVLDQSHSHSASRSPSSDLSRMFATTTMRLQKQRVLHSSKGASRNFGILDFSTECGTCPRGRLLFPRKSARGRRVIPIGQRCEQKCATNIPQNEPPSRIQSERQWAISGQSWRSSPFC